MWGWSGSVISVFRDGTLLRSCDVPPCLPRLLRCQTCLVDRMVGVISPLHSLTPAEGVLSAITCFRQLWC